MPDLNEHVLDAYREWSSKHQPNTHFATWQAAWQAATDAARRQHVSAAQAVGGDIAAGHFKPHPATREWQEVPRHTPGAVILYHAAGWPHAAAEQPAAEQAKAAHVGWRNEKDGRPPAAGNALTDEQSHAEFMRHFPMPEGLRASVYDAWQHDQLRRKEGWEAAIKHLRAAPQAAQGEGLTIDTPQFRVLVSSVAWESRTAPSDAFEAALNRLIAHIDQTIAAHTRASDGKDAGRLDWMIHRGARISHSMDGEACNVWLPAERDGTEERPAEGYPQKRYNDGREAIDAAMQQAASTSAEGAHGEAK